MPTARDGVLDLRGADFTHGAVPLGGLWELYPGQLRSLGQLPLGRHGDTLEQMASSARWRRHLLTSGAALPEHGALTLRLRVRLPGEGPEGEVWAIKAGTRGRAMRVLVRDRLGRELMHPLSAGIVSQNLMQVRGSKQTLIARLLPPTADPDGQSAEIEVVVQLASGDTPENASDISIYLGRNSLVRAEQSAAEQLQLVIIGVSLVIGLYHLAMFAIRRNEPAPLYFGLFCIAIVIRLYMLYGFMEARLLGSWPPGLAWDWQKRLEYCSFFLAVPLFCLYLRALFPGYFSRRALQGLLIAAIAASAWVLLLPIYPATRAVGLFEKVTLAVVCYIAFRMVQLLRRGEASDQETARFIAAGTLLLVFATANDILNNNHFFKTFVAEHYAMFGFIFCQAFVLALNNARARLRAENLARELDQKNVALEATRKDLQNNFRELEAGNAKFRLLNEELLRQIDQRSRRLLDMVLHQPGAPPRQPAALAVGSMLGEVYQVVRIIGQGAMGAVYEVKRITDNERLAAKVLSTEEHKTALMRFAREAQLLAKFTHPNLIRILDVDVTSGGTLFLVMELVTGTTLRQLRSRYGDCLWALSILQQVAAALAAVHERGIVHRDVKPANILIAEDAKGSPSLVKLADFGVSVMARGSEPSGMTALTLPTVEDELTDEQESTQSVVLRTAPNGDAANLEPGNDSSAASESGSAPLSSDDLTEFGMLIGTPMYMAPELASGSRQAKAASDIFSFGVIAYELITQEMPFKKPPIGMVMQREAFSIPMGLRGHKELTPRLVQLFEEALSADPERRPTAAELAAALASP